MICCLYTLHQERFQTRGDSAQKAPEKTELLRAAPCTGRTRDVMANCTEIPLIPSGRQLGPHRYRVCQCIIIMVVLPHLLGIATRISVVIPLRDVSDQSTVPKYKIFIH